MIVPIMIMNISTKRYNADYETANDNTYNKDSGK